MKMRMLALIGLGTGCLQAAPGGTLRLRNSVGLLTVEAWDRPDIEITTIKSTKVEYDAGQREKAIHRLASVRFKAARNGDEIVATTDYPRYRAFALEYHIRVPATARIVGEHGVGNVNIDGLVGDVDINLLRGQIVLHLPDGQYNIHAKSDFGGVNSDFSGQEKSRPWLGGHQSVNGNLQAPHNVKLRVGFGDIILLKTRIPVAPEPLLPGGL